MADKIFLKRDDIEKLISAVSGDGGVFVAPSSEARLVKYKPVTGVDEIEFDYVIPSNSFKEYLFPQTEVIARFDVKRDGVELEEEPVKPVQTVVFGARPCDAVSVASLGSVFTWDYIDEYYTKREDATVVMTVACSKADEECFCTSVGVTPEESKGSDILLRETEEGDFIAEPVTDGGKDFIEAHKEAFTEKVTGKAKAVAEPRKIEGADLDKVDAWLKDKDNYDSPLWAEMARKCVGCGACTYSCPTCHCFDITDEGTFFSGERRKNWDACQFDHFTLHASGHNPRDTQYKRWRNRFMCKFNFYPHKFKEKGCVGCGRCVRVCAVRMDITEVIEEISKQ